MKFGIKKLLYLHSWWSYNRPSVPLLYYLQDSYDYFHKISSFGWIELVVMGTFEEYDRRHRFWLIWLFQNRNYVQNSMCLFIFLYAFSFSIFWFGACKAFKKSSVFKSENFMNAFINRAKNVIAWTAWKSSFVNRTDFRHRTRWKCQGWAWA